MIDIAQACTLVGSQIDAWWWSPFWWNSDAYENSMPSAQ